MVLIFKSDIIWASGQFLTEPFPDDYEQWSNEKLDAKLKKEGGVVVDQVSKDTFAVIVKDISKESGKVKKARSLNIPVYELQNYVK